MTTPVEEPREGGSYIRHPDGSLERVEFTAPAKPRDKRELETPNTTPASEVDPEAANGAASGETAGGKQE